MKSAGILTDGFSRIGGIVSSTLAGLDAEALAFRPDSDANSIAWLIWHLTRTQDDHVADIIGRPQVWVKSSWPAQLDLDGVAGTGYGFTSAQVAAVRPSQPEPLAGYYDEVAARTLKYLGTITDNDLDRIIDESWDPPVTVGVRLVSVLGDCLQHAGQAAYVRGLYTRRGSR